MFDIQEGSLKMPPGLENLDKSEPMCSQHRGCQARVPRGSDKEEGMQGGQGQKGVTVGIGNFRQVCSHWSRRR